MASINKPLIIAALIMAFSSSNAFAASKYVTNLTLARVKVQEGVTLVGTTTQPANTCSNEGEYFKFDHTTPSGKDLLSLLLAAKASDGVVLSVWYTVSPAPGTTETTGCDISTISVLNGVGIN
ncbi:MAG: hypothetical protein A2511_10060 [Deltaproteobacteria bacterium RIFOXYD12_FULL_50_9]|nr:MAG: hypothetical protein A2511_10060 [Deltaproteobacteria bacterium RIFOXYD12_FULL_50_9]